MQVLEIRLLTNSLVGVHEFDTLSNKLSLLTVRLTGCEEKEQALLPHIFYKGWFVTLRFMQILLQIFDNMYL